MDRAMVRIVSHASSQRVGKLLATYTSDTLLGIHDLILVFLYNF